MKNITRRLLAFTLAVIISLSSFPTAAFADTGQIASQNDAIQPGLAVEKTVETVFDDVALEYVSSESLEEADDTAEMVVLAAKSGAEENEEVNDEIVNESESENQEEEFAPLSVVVDIDTTNAYLGGNVIMKAELSDPNIAVKYQWQVQKPLVSEVQTGRDIPEGVETEYDYDDNDITSYFGSGRELEDLAVNAYATWPGMEMWRAVNEAAKAVGYTKNLTFETYTRNYTLMGYETAVEYENNTLAVKFIKGDVVIDTVIKDNIITAVDDNGIRHTYEAVWENIEGATEATYTHVVQENDDFNKYKCLITITDEEYLNEIRALLMPGVDYENNKEEFEKFISELESDYLSFAIFEKEELANKWNENEELNQELTWWQKIIQWFKNLWNWFVGLFVKDAEAADPVPQLSSNGAYISGVNDNYWYVKENNANNISKWTRIGGIENKYFRTPLTGGKMAVLSAWLGKTVCFAPDNGSGKPDLTKVTKIKIPAISTNTQYYKQWISVLNIAAIDIFLGNNGNGTWNTSGKTSLDLYMDKTSRKGPDGYKGYFLVGAAQNNPNAIADETSLHLDYNAVSYLKFNARPEYYLKNAEGDYVVDSVIFNGNIGSEPDISGAAYYALKDYISSGYGALIGHDTLYAYAGAYNDNYSGTYKPDKNDTSTYYHLSAQAEKEIIDGVGASVLSSNGCTVPGCYSTDLQTHKDNHRKFGQYPWGDTGYHWNMNELFGWNGGSISLRAEQKFEEPDVKSKAEAMKLSLSGIISSGSAVSTNGGSGNQVYGYYSKSEIGPNDFGLNALQIKKQDFSGTEAINNVFKRQPTNFPFYLHSAGIEYVPGFAEETIKNTATHSNGGLAFGDVWVQFITPPTVVANPSGYVQIGGLREDTEIGYTNNFYLSGNGNFLQNQNGHTAESMTQAVEFERNIYINSVFYVSQRKQCEVCQSHQSKNSIDSNGVVDFVVRINKNNVDTVFETLRAGGNLFYPLDGCYMLAEDLVLPEDWAPIEGFVGHFNANNFKVDFSNVTGTKILFAEDATESAEIRFYHNHVSSCYGKLDCGMTSHKHSAACNNGVGCPKREHLHTTSCYTELYCPYTNSDRTAALGIARAVGFVMDLRDSFIGEYAYTTDKNYNFSDWRLDIYGSNGKTYTIQINNEGKYVVSNLPCTGTLKARLYDSTNGKNIIDPNILRVTIPGNDEHYNLANLINEDWHWRSKAADFKGFLDTCETTQLYVIELTPAPIEDKTTMDESKVVFESKAFYNKKADNVQWYAKGPNVKIWTEIEKIDDLSGKYSISAIDYIENASDEANSYSLSKLTIQAATLNLTNWQFATGWSIENSEMVYSYDAMRDGYEGRLTVKAWPLKTTQDVNKEIWEGENVSFTNTTYFFKGVDNGLKAEWQYTTNPSSNSGAGWNPVTSLAHTVTSTSKATSITEYGKLANLYGFTAPTAYATTTTITLKNCSHKILNETYYRVKYTYEASNGKIYTWYSNNANGYAYRWLDSEDAKISNWPDIFSTGMGASATNRLSKLTIKPAKIEAVMLPATTNQDNVTPDPYGQLLKLEDSGYASGAAQYKAIIYSSPASESIMPVDVTWFYKTNASDTAKTLNGTVSETVLANGKKQKTTQVTALNGVDNELIATITTIYHGIDSTSPYYKAEYADYAIIETTLVLERIPAKMYDSDTNTKYYFTCSALGEIIGANKKVQTPRVKEGGLVLSHAINIDHMGVHTYGSKNIVNDKEATTEVELLEYAKGQTSKWTYPNLVMSDNNTKSFKTVYVYMKDFSYGKTAQEQSYMLLPADGVTYANNNNITVLGNSASDMLTFKLPKGKEVDADVWANILRQVEFHIYDPDTTDNKESTAVIEWQANEIALKDDMAFNPNNGHYYEFITETTQINWKTAKQYAESKFNDITGTYGYLASITSQDEWDYVKSLIDPSETTWLGGYSAAGSNLWSWAGAPESEAKAFFKQGNASGGTLVWGYQTFASGLPNEAISNENALIALPNTLAWDDVSVGAAISSYVIEWAPEEIHTYAFVEARDGVSWADASALAAASKDANTGAYGYLAEINSPEEQQYIQAMLGGNEAWIGLYQDANGITWNKNKNPGSYTNFASGYSNTASDNWGYMKSDGTWDFYVPTAEVNTDDTWTFATPILIDGGLGTGHVTKSDEINIKDRYPETNTNGKIYKYINRLEYRSWLTNYATGKDNSVSSGDLRTHAHVNANADNILTGHKTKGSLPAYVTYCYSNNGNSYGDAKNNGYVWTSDPNNPTNVKGGSSEIDPVGVEKMRFTVVNHAGNAQGAPKAQFAAVKFFFHYNVNNNLNYYVVEYHTEAEVIDKISGTQTALGSSVVEYNDKYYTVVTSNENLTHEEAEQRALDLGGKLASSGTLAKNQALTKALEASGAKEAWLASADKNDKEQIKYNALDALWTYDGGVQLDAASLTVSGLDYSNYNKIIIAMRPYPSQTGTNDSYQNGQELVYYEIDKTNTNKQILAYDYADYGNTWRPVQLTSDGVIFGAAAFDGAIYPNNTASAQTKYAMIPYAIYGLGEMRETYTQHEYKLVVSDSHISWRNARTAAQGMTSETLGTNGYLAHITSAEEWNYVWENHIKDSGVVLGWLGGYRANPEENSTTNGINHVKMWFWADGPQTERDAAWYEQSQAVNTDSSTVTGQLYWGYANWAGNNPDGYKQTSGSTTYVDQYLTFYGPGFSSSSYRGLWNDMPNNGDPYYGSGTGKTPINAYLVEFSPEEIHKYAVFSDANGFDDAMQKAAAKWDEETSTYGYLAHITSADELTEVKKVTASNKTYLTGLQQYKDTGIWKFYDGPLSEQSNPMGICGSDSVRRWVWRYKFGGDINPGSIRRDENRNATLENEVWNHNPADTAQNYIVEWSGEPVSMPKQPALLNTMHSGVIERANRKGVVVTENTLASPIAFYENDGLHQVAGDSANQGIIGVNAFIVEFETAPDAAFAFNTAEDRDTIFTNKIPEVAETKFIAAQIIGLTKEYDGLEAMPTIKVQTNVAHGNPKSLLEVFYGIPNSGNDSTFAPKTLSATASFGSGIKNVGEYPITISLTQEAIDAGWILVPDEETGETSVNGMESILTDIIKITPIEVTVQATGNSKVYDGTPDILVDNLTIKDNGKYGVDTITLEKTNDIEGFFTDASGNPFIHVGNNMPIIITEELKIIGDDFGNYIISPVVDAIGDITPRPIQVHSYYHETVQKVYHPILKQIIDVELNEYQNFKAYDSSYDITIDNFIIDNIVQGDTVDIEGGRRAALVNASATEELDANGKPKADRFRNLDETPVNLLTPLTDADLINDPYGDYHITSVNITGAVYRTYLEVEVNGTTVVYGNIPEIQPYTNGFYNAENNGVDTWLTIWGFKGKDSITIDDSRSDFSFIQIPPTADSGTSTIITYTGLNESNYEILKNYIVSIMPGNIYVSPRGLKIIVNGGYTKEYLAQNPKFEVIYEGFVNGDTPETELMGELKFETFATQTSPILYLSDERGNRIDNFETPADEHVIGSYGSYVVAASGLECKENSNGTYNYQITYVDGDLTIKEGDYTVHYDGNGATDGLTVDSVHTYNHTDKLTKNAYARAYTITYDYNFKTEASPAPRKEKVQYNYLGWSTTARAAYAKDQAAGLTFVEGTVRSPVKQGDTLIKDKSYVFNLKYTKPNDEITLYAVWQKNGTRTPDAERRGFELIGWSVDPNSPTPDYDVGDVIYPTKDMTLYAVWEIVESIYAEVGNISEDSPYVDTNKFMITDDGEVAIEIFGPVTTVTVTYPEELETIDEANSLKDFGFEEKTYVLGVDPELVEVIPGVYYVLKPQFEIPFEINKLIDNYLDIPQTVKVTASFTTGRILTANPIFFIVDDFSMDFHTILK